MVEDIIVRFFFSGLFLFAPQGSDMLIVAPETGRYQDLHELQIDPIAAEFGYEEDFFSATIELDSAGGFEHVDCPEVRGFPAANLDVRRDFCRLPSLTRALGRPLGDKVTLKTDCDSSIPKPACPRRALFRFKDGCAQAGAYVAGKGSAGRRALEVDFGEAQYAMAESSFIDIEARRSTRTGETNLLIGGERLTVRRGQLRACHSHCPDADAKLCFYVDLSHAPTSNRPRLSRPTPGLHFIYYYDVLRLRPGDRVSIPFVRFDAPGKKATDVDGHEPTSFGLFIGSDPPICGQGRP